MCTVYLIRNTKIIIASLIVTCMTVSVHGQSNAWEMAQVMGRGINIGNTLSAPQEGNWAPPATEQFFIDVAEAGFTVVRIPIRFDNQTQTEEPYLINPAYLDRIEEVTGWALEQDLVAIIDVHGDHWFWDSFGDGDPNTPTESTYARFMSIWTQIAEKFANSPEKLLFEIMNEPYFSMSKEEVDQVNEEVLEIIRETNPTRNVIITGGGMNSYKAPLQIDPEILTNDAYLIATFHYYRPFKFTSSSKEEYSDYQWGSEEDKQVVDSEFDQVQEWSEIHDTPVFLGEFGADNLEGLNYHTGAYGDFGGPDSSSRVEYHRYVSQAAVVRGFPFAAWCGGSKSNKAIHLRSDNIQNAVSGVWVEDVRDALLAEFTSSYRDVSIEGIKVFPNPACDYIKVESEFPYEQVIIYDSSGKVQLSIKGTTERIELDGLSPGYYLLVISGAWGNKGTPVLVK